MDQETQDAFNAVLRAAADAYGYAHFSELRVWVDSDGDMRLIYVPEGCVQGGYAVQNVTQLAVEAAQQ